MLERKGAGQEMKSSAMGSSLHLSEPGAKCIVSEFSNMEGRLLK